MKTFKQWLRTRDGKKFSEIAKNFGGVMEAMQASWDAGQKQVEESVDEEYDSHEAWCQTHYVCNCGADKRNGRA